MSGAARGVRGVERRAQGIRITGGANFNLTRRHPASRWAGCSFQVWRMIQVFGLAVGQMSVSLCYVLAVHSCPKCSRIPHVERVHRFPGPPFPWAADERERRCESMRHGFRGTPINGRNARAAMQAGPAMQEDQGLDRPDSECSGRQVSPKFDRGMFDDGLASRLRHTRSLRCRIRTIRDLQRCAPQRQPVS